MDFDLFVAITAVFINLILSTIIPCLLKESNEPILVDIKNVFKNNKKLIITSSIVVGFIVYLTLKIADSLDTPFSNMTGINFTNKCEDDYGFMKVQSVPIEHLNFPFFQKSNINNNLPIKNLLNLS
jgi:hypothetical protein